MKYIFCLGLFFLINSLQAQEAWSSFRTIDLKGNEKTIIEINYLPAKSKKKPSELLDSSVYFFNEKGLLESEEWYSFATNDTVRLTYHYDTTDHMTGYRFWFGAPDYNFYHDHIYTLNEKGEVVASLSFGSDGDSISRNTFSYDDRGRLAEDRDHEIFEMGGEVAFTTKYSYSDDDNLPDKMEFFGADGVVKVSHSKNENGLVMEQDYTDEKGKVSANRYEYEFDDHGNWVLRTTYVKGKVVDIMIRDITYFE